MRCISTFYRRAQRQRRGCSIPPEYLLNLSGRGAQSHAEYSITEVDDKTIFCGTIQYIGPYANEKGIRKVISKVEEFLLEVLLLPIIIIVKVYQLFSWAIQKATGRTKSKEESLEDKLYDRKRQI